MAAVALEELLEMARRCAGITLKREVSSAMTAIPRAAMVAALPARMKILVELAVPIRTMVWKLLLLPQLPVLGMPTLLLLLF
jgi:hypothetical protein